MIRLGLIGYPLGHSLSPKIHNASLKSCGLDGSYSLFPIHPDDKEGLKELLERIRSGEITGLNVTIPHKQNVMEFLNELTPTAATIGAVNTIYTRDHKLIGENTDAPGFLSDMNGFLDMETRGHEDSNALVLGAGGSARAVVYALIHEGWNVLIAARRTEQVNELTKQFDNVNAIEYNVQTFKLLNVQLIVNTTPVGMTPNVDQSPWPTNLPFPPRAFIYDLVYNPGETKLVRDARHHGLQATTGLGMLIEQAVLAFEIWTGHRPSREVMFTSVEQSLVSNYQLPITPPGSD
jgi:shikimate dehydrogenase